MKLNKNKQLVEDIFDDFCVLSQGFETLVFRDYLVTLLTFKAYKELMGRESVGVVVYVSDNCKRFMDTQRIESVVSSDKTDYFKNKAIIQLVEEE